MGESAIASDSAIFGPRFGVDIHARRAEVSASRPFPINVPDGRAPMRTSRHIGPSKLARRLAKSVGPPKYLGRPINGARKLELLSPKRSADSTSSENRSFSPDRLVDTEDRPHLSRRSGHLAKEIPGQRRRKERTHRIGFERALRPDALSDRKRPASRQADRR